MTRPMSSETLRDIRSLTRDSERSGSWIARDLLAEVDRLNAKLDRIRQLADRPGLILSDELRLELFGRLGQES